LFTPEERDFLLAMIQSWEEGIGPSEEATSEDPEVCDDPDRFLAQMTGYSDERRLCVGIRSKVLTDSPSERF
jgi:hypothetical protein